MYSTYNGSTICGFCQPGSYADVGWSRCLPCPRGRYQSADGQSSCNSCLIGSYSDVGRYKSQLYADGLTPLVLSIILNLSVCVILLDGMHIAVYYVRGVQVQHIQ
jgi:hypothetical protein